MKTKKLPVTSLSFFFLLCFLLLLSGCEEKYEFTGIVADLKKDQGSFHALVIRDTSKEEISGMTTEEIMELASEPPQDGMYKGISFYVDKKTFKKLEKGQQVTVTFSGPAQESLPPQASAKKIDIVQE